MPCVPWLVSVPELHRAVEIRVNELVESVGTMEVEWNGSGVPAKLRGEAIALPARVALIADAIVPAGRIGGAAAIREVAARRSGRAFDPALAELIIDHAEDLAVTVESGSPAFGLRRRYRP